MPAGKTRYIKTPQYNESILSNAIRKVAGTEHGPDWANKAPQYKTRKVRDYVGKNSKSYKNADRID